MQPQPQEHANLITGHFDPHYGSMTTHEHSEHELQPGDILFFLPAEQGLTLGQKLISCWQSIDVVDHGDSKITHVAICVGVDNDVEIADVTGQGYRRAKLKKNQPVLVMRSQESTFAETIAAEAVSNIPTNIRWNCCVGFGLFNSCKSTVEVNEIDLETVCSQFVCDILKHRAGALSLHDASNPVTLLKQLIKNDQFKLIPFIFMGKHAHCANPLQYIEQVIQEQLLLLKGEALREAIEEYTESEKTIKRLSGSDFERAQFLVEQMKPVFAKKHGLSLPGKPKALEELECASSRLKMHKYVDKKFTNNQSHRKSFR